MRIRTKLSLVLILAISLPIFAVSLAFLSLIGNYYKQESGKKVQMTLEAAERIARESVLANDPLLLLSYLSFIKKTHPELIGSRVYMDKRWIETPKMEMEGRVPGRILRVGSTVQGETLPGGPVKKIVLELLFSKEELEKESREAFKEVAQTAGLMILFFCILGVVVAVILSHLITRPVSSLAEAIQTMHQGKLGVRTEVFSKDEIGQLAAKFNEMSEQLAKLDEMKKDFVSAVTHELKSPLKAIESFVRLLLESEKDLKEDQKDHLLRIQENAVRLERFVSNLLEAAKIEKGKLEMTPKKTDLTQLISDTVLFLSPRAQVAEIGLSCELDPSLPEIVADPDLIQQVFINLISNAIKYTKKTGEIHVSAHYIRKNGSPEAIECSVSDTGIGISQEDQNRIFSMFERIKNPIKASGAGLGLWISKSILEMHGSKIFVESEPGKGSRFYFQLPVNRPITGQGG